MNIFVLDRNPTIAAQYLCDKHVVKMALESTQILCTVASKLGIPGEWYRPTHKNHPCVMWATSSASNMLWLIRHTGALFREYALRYSKIHKSCLIAEAVQNKLRQAIGITPNLAEPNQFVLCMPETYKQSDPVLAYRAYYKAEKTRFATYRPPRAIPDWMLDAR